MAHYVHHLPGRLRIKCHRLKNNEHRAHRMQTCLQRLNGVVSAEVNTTTGSLLVRYDAGRIPSEIILSKLIAEGFALDPRHAKPGAKPDNPLATMISDKVVNKMLETVVERSAVALLAALV